MSERDISIIKQALTVSHLHSLYTVNALNSVNKVSDSDNLNMQQNLYKVDKR
jgi:hypothetical protein